MELKVKEYRDTYAPPDPGNFALEPIEGKNLIWDYCREQFAPKFSEGINGFYFSHPPDLQENIASFINKFEVVLSLYDYSNFSLTPTNTVLWVSPCIFWKECELRRSLFTILLRAGYNYNPDSDNFDEALFSDRFSENKYLRETKQAVMRFLFGFTIWTEKRLFKDNATEYTLSKHGWLEEFKYCDLLAIRRKLSSESMADSNIIGNDSLWT